MSNLQSSNSLFALNGSGVVQAPAGGTGLVTLAATDDFYFPIPFADSARNVSIHIQTTALIAGTFTVEVCNFPVSGLAGNVTDYDETAGGIWTQINIAAAGYAQGVGTGWTWTVLSGAKTAGVGAAIINLVDVGSRRLRLKAAITTTGTCRVVPFWKV